MIRFICASLLCIVALSSAKAQQEVVIPKNLSEGSRIALVTPAGAIKDAYIDTACVKLNALGYEPVVFPHAYGRQYGSFPATDEERAADLMAAFADPSIDAILCTRGGYGCVRLLPMLDQDVIRANPKWLIGYSDISILHALMHKLGVASIHGPMAAHITNEPDTLASTQYLYKILTDSLPMQYLLDAHPYNKSGVAKGRLVGGNLITLDDLSATPYDMLNTDGGVLFIEDVSEKIYAIERILMRLHYSGVLSRLSGLIIGQFTDYPESDDFESMEDMIYYWLNKWDYYDSDNPMPIVFGFPTGHVSDNNPMVVSAEVELIVSPFSTMLNYTGK